MRISYGTNDLNRILNIINPSFGAVREDGFDFRYIMPKAYGEKNNLLQYHYVVSDGGVDVTTAGNIPGKIVTHTAQYRYAFLGSVATLPAYEGKGYMRALMKRIKQDDITDGKVFSLLTGARVRYARHGYTKVFSAYSFVFDEYFAKHTTKNPDISIRAYSGDINALYEIYQSTQPIILRSKDDILPCLSMSRSALRLIEYRGKTVGYYTFCTRKKLYIPEFAITDCSLVGSVMREVFDVENVAHFSVYVNPLDVRLRNALDVICEAAHLCDELQIRVYDLCAFIKMLVELNIEKSIIDSKDFDFCVVVDGKKYDISVADTTVNVHCTKSDIVGCSVSEFLRGTINNPFSSFRSEIFPLAFGISLPDCF